MINRPSIIGNLGGEIHDHFFCLSSGVKSLTSPSFQLLGEASSRYTYSLLLRKAILCAIHVAQQDSIPDDLPVPPSISFWDDSKKQEDSADSPDDEAIKDMGEAYATDEDILAGEVDQEQEEDKEEAQKATSTGPLPDTFRNLNLNDSGDPDHIPLTEANGLLTYPVRLTNEQRTNALSLHAALSQSASQEERLNKLHILLLSLFCDQIEGYKEKRSSSFVEAFLLAINVLPSGGIRPVVNITPVLSQIQYFILFSILKEAMNRKRLEGIEIAT